jgi:hypothetical protein
LLLQQFNFRVEHLAGSKNQVADALSRKPQAEEKANESVDDNEPNPVGDLDPTVYLATLTDVDFPSILSMDIDPIKQERAKDRHRRKHSTVVTLAPLKIRSDQRFNIQSNKVTQGQNKEAQKSNDKDVVGNEGRIDEHEVTLHDETKNSAVETDDQISDEEKLKQQEFEAAPITLEEQMKDEFFADIINYLLFEELPTNTYRARKIILQAENYQIINDQLVKLATSKRRSIDKVKPIQYQLCVPPAWRLDILRHYHDTLSHIALEKMYLTIRNRYTWPTLFADCKDWYDGCPVCIQIRTKRGKEITLQSHEIPSAKFSTLCIDHHGYIHSASPYKYILLAWDLFSQRCTYIPVKTASAVETAQALWDQYFTRFGMCQKLISDRGTAFLNDLVRELTKLCGVKQVATSPYRPSSNPVELCNKHIIRTFRAYQERQIDDWHILIPTLNMAQASLQIVGQNFSPFFIQHGVDMTLPIDLDVNFASYRFHAIVCLHPGISSITPD